MAPVLTGNFFTVDLKAAKAAFEQVPWVREAQVRDCEQRLSLLERLGGAG